MLRFLNVLIRLLTLLIRLYLIILLAQELTVEDFGRFSLFVAVAAYSTLILGLDFYTYFQRLIDHKDRISTTAIIKAQLRTQSLAYLVTVPLSVIVALHFGIEKEWILFLIFIAIIEHVAQETYRILIIINKNTEASFHLFLRTAAWVLFLIIIAVFKTISLKDVYYMWMLFTFSSSLFGLYTITRHSWCNGVSPFKISKTKLFKTALFFLISSLSFKLLFTLDRSLVARFSSVEILGAYALYSGIAFTLINFLSPTVIAFNYPKLISASNDANLDQFLKVANRMFLEILAVSTCFLTGVYFFAPILLEYVGKPDYIDRIHILYFVCGASILYALSMVPHYILYSLGREIHITISSVLSVILFAQSFFILLKYFNADMAVSLASVLAFSFLAVYKGIMSYISFKKEVWVIS